MLFTLAGKGEEGFSSDGGLTATTRLSGPCEIATDSTGSVYVGTRDYRIRKIYATGVISTVAGTGERGSAGDGGAAVRARLRDPCVGITTEAAGNVYVVDGNRIRSTDSAGVIEEFPSWGRWRRKG